MEKIYERPHSLIEERGNSFCPGCMHGVAGKLIAEVLDELGQQENTVIVYPIGCGAMNGLFIEADGIVALHGRAPATATGIKRSAPEKLVFTYQGDGDLASIGFAEIMHAANRGENFAVFFVNNSIYGMTGGQMAPTTLEGQKSTTTPMGRNIETEGAPMHMCELVSALERPVYVERVALDTPAHINAAKKAIKKALQNELDCKGFSFVELMSNCPTNWGCSVEETLPFMKEKTLKEFPLGVYKDKEEA